MKWTSMETRHMITLRLYVVLSMLTLGRSSREGLPDIALLHTTVRHMLGFRDRPTPPPLTLDVPPYMTRLYDMYRTGGVTEEEGDTVRGIYPQIRNDDTTTTLIFNLSSLSHISNIYKSQLRLYKPSISRTNGEIRVSLHKSDTNNTISDVRVNDRDSRLIYDVSESGWVLMNVTDIVKNCVTNFGDDNNCYLSVTLFTDNSTRQLPFLFVYSKDNNAQLLLNKNPPDRNVAVNDKTETGSRVKRSLLDNEIPQGPPRFNWSRIKILKSHPSILITRQQRYKNQKYGKSKLLKPLKSNRFRRRKHRRGRKNRRRHRKRKGSKSRKLPVPKAWKVMQQNLVTSQDKSVFCGRHQLKVNFHDIGWGEWIISPKTFEANYCAGTCPFPLTKASAWAVEHQLTRVLDLLNLIIAVNPSNHATIQSIVHALGLDPHVPAPCCVPGDMTSITLLYFDENKNVVLKNYPEMSVSSCSCR